jgi:hypothetical protein
MYDRIPNEPVRMPLERVNQHKVVGSTNYREEFPKKSASTDQKVRHSDNLKVGGAPISKLTTYSQNFFAKASPTVPFVLRF